MNINYIELVITQLVRMNLEDLKENSVIFPSLVWLNALYSYSFLLNLKIDYFIIVLMFILAF